jgi:negative regulator of sigma E activity
MKESLSALLDGECSDSELEQILSALERDPALRQHLSHQYLARDSRLGTRVRTPDPDFSSRVLAALQDEPAVVVPFAGRVRRLPWRAAASLAAAAALGAVAVLVVRPQAPLGTVATQTVAAPIDATAAGEPAERQFAELEDENARQLRNYVMAYSQSRGQQGVGSTLGYARYAAYTDAATPPAAPRTTELKQP